MSLATDRGSGKRARRQVSERLRAYHDSVIRTLEPDSETFFHRVMARAESEQVNPMTGTAPQPQGAQF
jgi:hypothetical protein